MKLASYIAFRYLFSKKKHNVINIISMICVAGICVATIALVCTLSVYNGFQQLITGLYNSFDPDLRITLVEGKNFDANLPQIEKLEKLPYVDVLAESLEENAMIRNKGKQTTITVKGVTSDYARLIRTDSVVTSGRFLLKDGENDFAVIGAASATLIEAGVFFVNPVSLYAPKYGAKVNIANPENAFNERNVYISGVYSVNQQEIDNKFAFVPIDFARELFGYGEVISTIELKLKTGTDVGKAKEEVASILGPTFRVQDKHEQHHEFYRMLKIEKWITFLILFFILLIAVVNVVGSLTMLIIEKKNDIRTLLSLGANNKMVRNIFLLEGWLVSVFGAILGVVIGLILCLVQEHFGILKLNNGGEGNAFIVDAYPVLIQWNDVMIILVTVLLVGFLVAWYPTRYLEKLK
ncbi:MAG: ABC transporter permease [Paludibacteraceae bacterium]|nr:ABC transporter permease [Paludibacteraceae bacterium]